MFTAQVFVVVGGVGGLLLLLLLLSFGGFTRAHCNKHYRLSWQREREREGGGGGELKDKWEGKLRASMK